MLWLHKKPPFHPGRGDKPRRPSTAAAQLRDALALLREPWIVSFRAGEYVMLNGVDLRPEVEAARAAYDAQQWRTFGESVGAALQKLRAGSQKPDSALLLRGGRLQARRRRQRAVSQRVGAEPRTEP